MSYEVNNGKVPCQLPVKCLYSADVTRENDAE